MNVSVQINTGHRLRVSTDHEQPSTVHHTMGKGAQGEMFSVVDTDDSGGRRDPSAAVYLDG